MVALGISQCLLQSSALRLYLALFVFVFVSVYFAGWTNFVMEEGVGRGGCLGVVRKL